ncbi:MAG: hypothetical protein A4E29_01402 [Methanomassiliicoccales archaeon PtaB.Bin134]|nr:MAG: hypothetical protein A4E29_01402 [Methanomassiliicoccales archaeon PtaB.Bin134]
MLVTILIISIMIDKLFNNGNWVTLLGERFEEV